MKFVLTDNGFQTNFNFGQLMISSDENKGFRPFQLMVASIASCSDSVFRKILKKQRLNVKDMTISAEVERNPRKANRIEKILLLYSIEGTDLNIERLQKNLAIARKNCAMIRSVERSITIKESIELIESS